MTDFLRWLIAELPPTACPVCTGLRETNPHGICGGCYYAQQDDGTRTPQPRAATSRPRLRPVMPAARMV